MRARVRVYVTRVCGVGMSVLVWVPCVSVCSEGGQSDVAMPVHARTLLEGKADAGVVLLLLFAVGLSCRVAGLHGVTEFTGVTAGT